MGKLISEYNKSAVTPAKPLPSARLHDLRHVHATALLLAGVPVHVGAARLGHADPAVTLRVYAHVLREQVASVGDIFAQAVKASVSNLLASRVGKTEAMNVSPGQSGAGERIRTADRPLTRRMLCQLSYTGG